VKSVVVYGSRSGNTRRIAQAIAGALQEYGPVRLVTAEDASATVWDQCDLLVVGGPTEGRHASPPVRAFFDRLPSHALRGLDAAAFDTRLDWPRMLTGSAALEIRRRLVQAGADIVVDPESFMVSSRPELRWGEIERAPIWARSVAEAAREASASPDMAQPAVA
jgi:flavorubredoxin